MSGSAFTLDVDQVTNLQRRMIKVPVLFRINQKAKQKYVSEEIVRSIQWYAGRRTNLAFRLMRANLLFDDRRRKRSPYRRTGNYIRSWRVVERNSAKDEMNYTASTDAPQALRLENGFNDTDSIGRTYRQPPMPHIRPGILRAVPFAKQANVDAIMAAFKEV